MKTHQKQLSKRVISLILTLALAVGLVPTAALAAEEADDFGLEETYKAAPSSADPNLWVRRGVSNTVEMVEPRTREELLALDGVNLSEDGEVISVDASKTGELSYNELQLLFFGDQPMVRSDTVQDRDQRLRERYGLTQTQIEQGISLYDSRLAFTSQLADLARSSEDIKLTPEQVQVLAELIASGYTNAQAQLAVVSKDILGFTLDELKEAQKAEIEATYQDDSATVKREGDEATYLAGKLGLPYALVVKALETRDGYEIEQAMEQAMDQVWDSVYSVSEDTAITFAVYSGSDQKTAYAPEEILGQPYSYDQQGNFDININTGAYSYTETDLSIPGKNGLNLVLTRQYHSDRANTRRTLGYYDSEGKASNIYEAETYASNPNATFKVFYRWFVIGGSDENGRYTFEEELSEHSWYTISDYENRERANTEAYFTLANYEYAVATMNAMNEAAGGDAFIVRDGSYSRIMTLVADITAFGRPFASNAINESNEDGYYVNEFGLGHGWMLGLSHLKWVFEGYGDYDALESRLKLTLSDGTQYNIQKRVGTTGNYIEGYEDDDIEFHACKTGEYPGAIYGLYHKDGKVEYFDYNGRNIAIQDRLGNTITIDYTLEEKQVKKIQITDTLDNVVVYEEVALEGDVPSGVRPFEYNKRWRLSLNGTTIREYFSLQEEKSLYTDSKTGQTKYTYPTKLAIVTNEAGELTRYTSRAVDVRFNSFLQPATHTLLADSTALYANDGYNVLVQMNSVTYPNRGESKIQLNNTKKPVNTLGSNGYQHYLCCDVVTPMHSGDSTGNSSTIAYTYGDFDGLEGLLGVAGNYFHTVVESRQSYPFYDESGEPTSGSVSWTNYRIDYKFDRGHRIRTESRDSYEAMPLRQDGIPSEGSNLPKVRGSWTSQKTQYVYNYAEDRHPSEITTTYKDITGAAMIQSETYTYDNKCNVLRYTKPDGQVVLYTYNSYSQPKTVTFKQNDTTTIVTTNYFSQNDKLLERTEVTSNGVLVSKTAYSYDSCGQLTAQDNYKDAENYVTTSYSYDYTTSALPIQASVSGVKTANNVNAAGSPGFAAGTVARKQTYNDRGWIMSETDANGNTTSYTYDAVGRLKSVTQPDGTSLSYDYDVRMNTVTYTDKAGYRWLCTYGKSGKLLKVVNADSGEDLLTNTYDRCDKLVKKVVHGKTTPDQTTYYRYDTDGRLIEQECVDANGQTLYRESYTYSYSNSCLKTTKTVEGDTTAPSIVTTTYQDNMGNIVKTGIFRNGVEEITTYAYDYLGNQTQSRTAYSASQNCAYTTASTYDHAGRLLSVEDADGNMTSYTYDWLGNQLTQTAPKDQNTDPSKTKYPTTYTYDALGRLLRVETPLAAGHTGRTDYTYDPNGNVTQERTLTGAKGNTSMARNTYYTYDSMGRVTQVRGNAKQDGQSGTDRYQFTNYTYDALGNIKSMSVGSGMNWETTQYTYDRYSRLLTQKDPLGQTQRYTYDVNGLLTGKTDRRGVTTTNTYDAMGRLTQSKAGTDTLTFTYTKTGQRRAATSNGQTTTYTYNSAGDLTKEVGPYATKTMTYGVGGVRERFTVTASGKTYLDNQYSYDELGHLRKVDGGSVEAHYSYDSNGNLANVKNGNGTTASYTYNKANLVTEVKNKRSSIYMSDFKYTYGADGNQLAKTNVTHSVTTNYTYDGLNRLTQESRTGTDAFTNIYTYDDFSNRSQAVLAGATTSYAYDANNRLLSTAGDDTASYTYDAQGNMTQATLTVGDTTRTLSYTYDGFNRLKKVSDNDGETVYTYDADGLRSSKTTEAGTVRYAYDGDQLVAVICQGGSEVAQFTLSTANGEIVHMPALVDGQSYCLIVNGKKYFAKARFIQGESDSPVELFSSRISIIGGETPEIPPVTENDRIVLEAGPVSMEMDVLGTEDSLVDTYVIGPANTAISLCDGDPDLLPTSYIRGLGLIAARTDKGVTYYHYNAHGDVVHLTDANGAVVKDYTYDAFGVEQNADATDTNPFRYCAEQYDAETGNYYLRARYYTPGVGGFTQEDPVMDGSNWYAYCGGNPVAFVDPSGLEWGALRDFVTDVEDILLTPDPVHETYVFSGSGADGRVTVQLGDGYQRRTGTFYFDGRVDFPIHRGNSSKIFDGIAQNIDGHLFMERTDFYRAMGINYVDVAVEFEVTKEETRVKEVLLSGVIALATKDVKSPVAAFFTTDALNQFGVSFFKEEGYYKGHAIYAEIHNPVTGEYTSMYTKEEYTWVCPPDQLGRWNLIYGPVTNFNGQHFESVVGYLKTHAYERW